MSNNNGAGLGFVGALTLVFITLKLTDYVGWSWWWVLSPVWISWGIALSAACVITLIWAVASTIKKAEGKREWADRHRRDE